MLYTVITIHFQNFFHYPKQKLYIQYTITLYALLPPTPSNLPLYSVSMNMPIPDTLCNWDHTISVFLYFAYFT